MVARKERTLIIQVQSLDGSAAPPSGPLHEELRDVAKRSGALDDPAALKSRFYSREARLCVVLTSLKTSRAVRTAIGTVRYVKDRPVKLTVVQVFGNARLARRMLAMRLEATLQTTNVLAERNNLLALLDKITEMQKR